MSEEKQHTEVDVLGDISKIGSIIEEKSSHIEKLKREIGKVIVGQEEMIESLILGLLTNGHILLEGMPGLAKTLVVNTLSKAVDANFQRIQFTPDLLPADLIGTQIYSPKREEFYIKKGPVFSNFVLADEINRSPAKVQSALLEAMQERQITIGEESFKLDDPFLVLATQNPIEQEGTYPLPEAQLDRFLFKVILEYPNKKEEVEIIKQNLKSKFPEPTKIFSSEKIVKLREVAKMVYIDSKINKYIVNIVGTSRNPSENNLKTIAPLISFGASPRASINIAIASKSYAFTKSRAFVIPEDVREVCHRVMRHRIGLTYEAEAENVTVDEIITKIIDSVEVP